MAKTKVGIVGLTIIQGFRSAANNFDFNVMVILDSESTCQYSKVGVAKTGFDSSHSQ